MKENLIVSLKYKDGQERKYNRTLKNIGDFPLVVLINKGSASASEIVTGAIKDYKRGTIIGEKTFGKGIVQQIIPLRTNDAIKLTIAQYFTPKGNYIHEKGIEPDIKVEMEELLTLKGYANDSEQARKNPDRRRSENRCRAFRRTRQSSRHRRLLRPLMPQKPPRPCARAKRSIRH